MAAERATPSFRTHRSVAFIQRLCSASATWHRRDERLDGVSYRHPRHSLVRMGLEAAIVPGIAPGLLAARIEWLVHVLPDGEIRKTVASAEKCPVVPGDRRRRGEQHRQRMREAIARRADGRNLGCYAGRVPRRSTGNDP